MESEFSGHGTWGYVVRTTERGQKVIQRIFIGDVDRREYVLISRPSTEFPIRD